MSEHRWALFGFGALSLIFTFEAEHTCGDSREYYLAVVFAVYMASRLYRVLSGLALLLGCRTDAKRMNGRVR